MIFQGLYDHKYEDWKLALSEELEILRFEESKFKPSYAGA